MKKFIFLFVFILAACGLKTQTLPQFYEGSLGDVTKIIIVDGSTGYKKTITNKVIVEDFLTMIKDIKFIPEENQEDRVGWRYSINLFEGNKETFQFTLTQVNEDYYYTEPDIHPIVEDFYKDLEVPEE